MPAFTRRTWPSCNFKAAC